LFQISRELKNFKTSFKKKKFAPHHFSAGTPHRCAEDFDFDPSIRKAEQWLDFVPAEKSSAPPKGQSPGGASAFDYLIRQDKVLRTVSTSSNAWTLSWRRTLSSRRCGSQNFSPKLKNKML
jgi:hypothetical protein